jgi:hypothetical protein
MYKFSCLEKLIQKLKWAIATGSRVLICLLPSKMVKYLDMDYSRCPKSYCRKVKIVQTQALLYQRCSLSVQIMCMVLLIQCYSPNQGLQRFLKDLICSKFSFPQGEPPGLQVEPQWLQSVPPELHSEPFWLHVNLHGPRVDPPKWASMAPLESLNVSMGNLYGSGAYKASRGPSTAPLVSLQSPRVSLHLIMKLHGPQCLL